jgi:hypothetical protein
MKVQLTRGLYMTTDKVCVEYVLVDDDHYCPLLGQIKLQLVELSKLPKVLSLEPLKSNI